MPVDGFGHTQFILSSTLFIVWLASSLLRVSVSVFDCQSWQAEKGVCQRALKNEKLGLEAGDRWKMRATAGQVRNDRCRGVNPQKQAAKQCHDMGLNTDILGTTVSWNTFVLFMILKLSFDDQNYRTNHHLWACLPLKSELHHWNVHKRCLRWLCTLLNQCLKHEVTN